MGPYDAERPSAPRRLRPSKGSEDHIVSGARHNGASQALPQRTEVIGCPGD